jgi:protein-disulfide isomerase
MEALQLGGERFATLGEPSAPITIVEFSDHGCPYCGLYHQSVFPTIKEQYIDTGKVYYVYKDYPVVSFQGALAAQAAECAGEQGRYWEMHDRLFDNPPQWNDSEEAAITAFRSYAEAIDADADVLAQCVSEGRYESDVQGDYEEGAALRLRGTPAFFIDGALLSGAQPLEVFVQALDERLAAAEGDPEAK